MPKAKVKYTANATSRIGPVARSARYAWSTGDSLKTAVPKGRSRGTRNSRLAPAATKATIPDRREQVVRDEGGPAADSVGQDARQDRANDRADEQERVEHAHRSVVQAERARQVEHHERRHDVETSTPGRHERRDQDEAQVAAPDDLAKLLADGAGRLGPPPIRGVILAHEYRQQHTDHECRDAEQGKRRLPPDGEQQRAADERHGNGADVPAADVRADGEAAPLAADRRRRGGHCRPGAAGWHRCAPR